MTRKLCTSRFLLPFLMGFLGTFLVSTPLCAATWVPLNGVQAQAEMPAIQLQRSDYSTIALDVSLAGFSRESVQTKNETFSRLWVGEEGFTTEIGQPQLPVIRRLIEIPYGAEATLQIGRTVLRQGSLAEFGIAERILPVQPSVEKVPGALETAPFVLDENAYARSEDAIGKMASLNEGGYLRGHRFVLLEIFPVDYNPAEGMLRIVSNVEITIQLTGSNPALTRQMKQHYADPYVRSLAGKLFLNHGFYDEQDLIPPPLGLLIITSPHNAGLTVVQDFALWKEQKGYHTTVATTNETGTTNQTIKAYIQEAYDTWPIPPNFVLLIGDTDVIPHWVGQGSGSPGTDLYYATLEGSDYFNDVGIGRLSPSNDANLANMVNKTLDYEQVGWTGNDEWEKSAVFMASNDNWTVSEGTHNYVISHYLDPDGYTSYRLYCHTYGATTQQVTDNFNAGRSLGIYSGHGSVTSWADGPPFSQSNVQALVNTVYPFVCSHACLTGQFQSGECFGETWIRVPHGAVVFWGSSVTSYWDEDDILEKGMFEGFFDEQSPSQDQNLTWVAGMTDYGKYYLWQHYGGGGQSLRYWEMYNILGDPTVDVWTDVPQILSVNFPGAVLIGQNSLQVTVSGYPDWAMVNVYSDAEDLMFTDYVTAGSVTFNMGSGFTVPGTMHVWVTGHDCHPYHGTASIIPPEGPYVIFDSLAVDDSNLGNNNGQLDYSETVELTIYAKNVGVEPATNVTLTIASLDPLLTVIDSVEYLGTLGPGATAHTSNGFTVQASSQLPDDYALVCRLTASDNIGNSWESNFSILGHAPQVEYERLIIHDETGNNNGNLDPGESADLEVILCNNGSSAVDNLAFTASCIDPYITITAAVSNVGSLAPGEEGSGTIAVEVSSACPQEHSVTFDLAITGGNGYAASDQFSTVVGNILYAPTGPDNYGYMAYDPFDAPETPDYDWVEICADSGGSGTLVNFTLDDQTFQFDLPFDFQYYGQIYNRYTIAANGWVGMGDILEDDYSNSGIPNSDGPPNMIAPYWEDLSPQRANSGKVWRWFDAANHRLVVEYNHIEQYTPTGAFETFQVILLDPAYYQTASGDGRILFQYKDMSGSAQTEGTVGIENSTETDGIQYLFDGSYDVHAHPITDGFAILFSTPTSAPDVTVTLTPYNPPIQIPASGGSFDYNIAVANNGSSPQVTDIWCMVTLPNGSSYGPVLGPINVTLPPGFSGDRDRTQNVPGSAPSGTYTYHGYVGDYPATIWDEDSFTFEKLNTGDGEPVEGWNNYGEKFEDWFAAVDKIAVPEAYSLGQNYPNPFNPVTSIRFGLPQAGYVKLAVYDLLGRQAALLVDGDRDVGAHEVSFDASDLASGIYVYRLQAGGFSASGKMILVK